VIKREKEVWLIGNNIYLKNMSFTKEVIQPDWRLENSFQLGTIAVI
jgi:hypothetical protein